MTKYYFSLNMVRLEYSSLCVSPLSLQSFSRIFFIFNGAHTTVRTSSVTSLQTVIVVTLTIQSWYLRCSGTLHTATCYI